MKNKKTREENINVKEKDVDLRTIEDNLSPIIILARIKFDINALILSEFGKEKDLPKLAMTLANSVVILARYETTREELSFWFVTKDRELTIVTCDVTKFQISMTITENKIGQVEFDLISSKNYEDLEKIHPVFVDKAIFANLIRRIIEAIPKTNDIIYQITE